MVPAASSVRLLAGPLPNKSAPDKSAQFHRRLVFDLVKVTFATHTWSLRLSSKAEPLNAHKTYSLGLLLSHPQDNRLASQPACQPVT